MSTDPTTTTATATATTTAALSDKEAQIYDRQIRLWGVDAQQRISKARVLIYGMNGLAAEIAKNIVLAGVGSVHLMDHQTVNRSLLGANFLVNESHLGMNRALASLQSCQELNPLVKVSAEPVGSLGEKLRFDSNDDDTFWSQFTIVLLCSAGDHASAVTLSDQIKVNDICRKYNIMFFCAETFGLFGLMFQDLINFDYSIKNPTTKETKSFHKSYVSLSDSLLPSNLKHVNRLSKIWMGVQCLKEYMDEKRVTPGPNDAPGVIQYKNSVFLPKYGLSTGQLPDEFMAVLSHHARAELSAICAQIGGIAAQEIIKVISRDAEPIDNYFVYDGVENFVGFIERIYPVKQ